MDGLYILLTFKRYILLLPTKQEGKTAFEKTFRKDKKPKPILLKIGMNFKRKNRIDEVEFIQAKFDEKKDQKETLIIGTTKKF